MSGVGQRHDIAVYRGTVVIAALVQGTVHATRLVIAYRALALGLGPLELGLIASAFGLSSMIAALPVGRVVDKRGETPFLALASVMLLAGVVGAAVGGSAIVLALAQAATGLGQLMNAVASQTLVGSSGSVRHRSARYGMYAAGASFGQLIGPVIGAYLVTALDAGAAIGPVSVLVAMTAATGIIGLWLWSLARRDGSRAGNRQVEAPIPILSVLRWPGMPLAMGTSIALNLGIDSLILFVPLYGEAHGIPVEVVGTLLAIRAGASVAVRLVTGAVVGRIGPERTLLGSTALAASSIACIPLTTDPLVLAGLMVLIGTGIGLGTPLTLTWVSMAAPPASRGAAIALRVSGNRLGQTVAPAVLGAIAGPAGVAAAFVALAAMLGSFTLMLLRTPLPDGTSSGS